MKVYRVEHPKTGKGPYHTRIGGAYLMPYLNSAHTNTAHPSPWQDSTINYRFNEGMVCGFESREALDKWFRGFKRKMDHHGFVIRVYEVPEGQYHIGLSQVIFYKKNSKRLDTLPMLR